MVRIVRPALAIAVSALFAAFAALPLLAQSNLYRPVLTHCGACLSVVNAFIRADVDARGQWVEGTTGGDPSTALDDDRRLLYGFSETQQSLIGTGFTTVRVQAGTFLTDFIASSAVLQQAQSDAGLCPPDCTAACPPECNGVITVWEVDYPQGSVRITETLTAADNPFSGRQDVIEARFDVHNTGTGTPNVGIRALLDVRVNENDGAPYIIPGIGNVTLEREFTGSSVPPFWLAFESSTYEPALLRAVGILETDGVVPPDRFVVARWGDIQTTLWRYLVPPTESVTNDSAVALYWNVRPLGPGQTRTYNTLYGVAGNRGGGAFLSSPVEAACEPFTVAAFVSNFDSAPLLGGQAEIQLPGGLALTAGQPASQPLPDIQPGDTASLAWEVMPLPGATGTLSLLVKATFAGGRQIDATAVIDVDCAQPTPAATVTPTPSTTPAPSPTVTPTRTPTPTLPSPTVSPTPGPTTVIPVGNVCAFIQGRVPSAVINAALAQPDTVSGWGSLCYRNRPPGPFNGMRQWLTLRNIGAPYHRLGNPLVYSCGCP
jgi:hypothetical protein